MYSLCLVFILQMSIVHQIIGDIKTFPKRLIKVEGDTAFLHCVSSVPNSPIQWTHRDVGAPAQESSFVYFERQLYESYNHGRHSVVSNESLKTCDLQIKNLSLGDAGTYTCAHVLDSSEFGEIQLTVIGAPPSCSSNVSLINVLVENDCGISPDYLELTCSTVYRGSFAPVLQWRHSAEPDIIISTSNSQPQSNSVTSHTLHLKSEIKLNGTRFICTLEGFGAHTQKNGCASPAIKIMYIFKPSAKSDHVDKSLIHCIANTSSQHCEYRWRGTHVSSNGTLESDGQTLQWDEHISNLRCETECEIRGLKCIVDSPVLRMPTDDNELSARNPWMIVVTLSAAVVGVLLLISAILIFTRRKSSALCWHTKTETYTHHSQKSQKEDLSKEVNISSNFSTKRYTELASYIDAVNGLADMLYSKNLLTEDECYRLTGISSISSYDCQARDLLNVLEPKLESESERRMFLEALINTDQRHVYNFLTESEDEDSIRIPTRDELHGIQKNYPALLDLINSSDYFLDQLARRCCITPQQKDRIRQHNEKKKRNRELLAVMKRRSFANFEAFKHVLEKNKQKTPARLLTTISGSLLNIHCTISIDDQKQNVNKLEYQICDSVNNENILQDERLIENQVLLLGASPTGSIVVYFLCETFDALIFFKHIYDSGELKTMMKLIFNSVMEKSSVICRDLEVSFEEVLYQKSVEEARKMMYFSETEKKIINPPFSLIPGEILGLILQKSFLILWSVEMESFEPENIQTGGYPLFLRFIEDKGMSISINLRAVSFRCIDASSVGHFFRQGIKQQFRICGDVLIPRLNCQFGLLESLVKAKVINEDEESGINGREDDVKSSNARLIECISDKTLHGIVIFLQRMSKMNLAHLLNYMFCSKKLESFDECWPLDDDTINRITTNKDMISKLSIMKQTSASYDPGDHGFKIESTLRKVEFLPVGFSLLDLLHHEGSISATQKRYIQDQPTGDMRTAALLQMLTTGSRKAHRTTLAYLRNTDQIEIYAGLTGSYIAKDAKLVQHVEICPLSQENSNAGTDENAAKKNVKVAWLDNRIYVACNHSRRLIALSDQKPFDHLKTEVIDLSRIKGTRDMTACRTNNIIYISGHNAELWKIQMPDKIITKTKVDGTPWNIFVMSSGELLATVEGESRNRLEIYSRMNFNLQQSIPLPDEIQHAWHAVQLSTGNFVVACTSAGTPQEGNGFFVCEISNGGRIVRSFESIYEKTPIAPWHLSIDSEDRILFCNPRKRAVLVLEPDWQILRMLLTIKKRHKVKRPERLCFVPEKDLLIVGNSTSVVSIFNLRSN